ncbi:hypothetical protein, partial [Lacticaseibacillus paracasei]|uniref:hypothetical protein n=1 Tax=Lacticaseibacillus paracasei TaxID=1597 RepID=UPI0031D83599
INLLQGSKIWWPSSTATNLMLGSRPNKNKNLKLGLIRFMIGGEEINNDLALTVKIPAEVSSGTRHDLNIHLLPNDRLIVRHNLAGMNQKMYQGLAAIDSRDSSASNTQRMMSLFFTRMG